MECGKMRRERYRNEIRKRDRRVKDKGPVEIEMPVFTEADAHLPSTYTHS